MTASALPDVTIGGKMAPRGGSGRMDHLGCYRAVVFDAKMAPPGGFARTCGLSASPASWTAWPSLDSAVGARADNGASAGVDGGKRRCWECLRGGALARNSEGPTPEEALPSTLSGRGFAWHVVGLADLDDPSGAPFDQAGAFDPASAFDQPVIPSIQPAPSSAAPSLSVRPRGSLSECSPSS